MTQLLLKTCLVLIYASSTKAFVTYHRQRRQNELDFSFESTTTLILPLLASTNHVEFHVAPMQCYTNAPLRHFFRLASPDAIIWTEMEKVPDVLDGSLQRRFGSPGHYDNVVLQLGGNNPNQLRDCLNKINAEGYTFSEVNLNCGCPSIDTGGAATYGASLMKDPLLTRKLLETMIRETTANVSLKCRIGLFETMEHVVATRENEYKTLHNYIAHAEQAGIHHVALHARPAILAGLNPTKNRQVPKLDYEVVDRIATDFPNLKVTLNGGISDLDHFEKVVKNHKQTRSYMAGRWMLRRPLDIMAVQTSHLGESQATPVECLNSYMEYVESNWDRHPLSELCLPLYLITEQLREDFVEENTTHFALKDIESLYGTIKESIEYLSPTKMKGLPDEPDFKKLSAAFKSLVGTKVANKWKRNRAEL